MHDPIGAFRAAICAAFGNAPEVIVPGRFHRFATNGRTSDAAGWCKLFTDLRGGVFGCMRQDISESWTADDRRRMTVAERLELARRIEAAIHERERRQQDEWAAQGRRNADLWRACAPLTDSDPAARYLHRRLGIEARQTPLCLRCHPGLPYWHNGERFGTFPVMIAPLTAPDGRVVSLHKTYLTDAGTKADVPGKEKRLTPSAGPLAGASIRLFSHQSRMIGVAEGIETALAAFCASGVPTVAAYCAGALAGYSWPAGVQSLVIFADADEAGREAADRLRARALHAGLRVNLMTPTEDGTDWADVWVRREAVAVEGGAV